MYCKSDSYFTLVSGITIPKLSFIEIVLILVPKERVLGCAMVIYVTIIHNSEFTNPFCVVFTVIELTCLC